MSELKDLGVLNPVTINMVNFTMFIGKTKITKITKNKDSY